MIDICATLNGKLGWCTYSTPMGSVPCLINIEKQRALGATGRRKVKPTKFLGESEATTLAKFHNDLAIIVWTATRCSAYRFSVLLKL